MFDKKSSEYRLECYFELIPFALNYTYSQEKSESGLTIKDLSEKTGFPVDIVLKDMEVLRNLTYSPLLFGPDGCEDSPLTADSTVEALNDFNQATYAIGLSIDEYNALYRLLGNKKTAKAKNSSCIPFLVKSNIRYKKDSEKLFAIIQSFNDAIGQNRQISFVYNDGFYTVTPVYIMYDNDENRYDLLCVHRKKLIVFDPEKILESFTPEGALNDSYGSNEYIHLMKQPSESVDRTNIQKKISHVWKNDFASDKPVHVKIRFNNEVRSFVERDIEGRGLTDVLYESGDEHFIFEDKIYGIDAFYSWVRSYGHNAIILEPKELATRHINNLKENLAQYS